MQKQNMTPLPVVLLHGWGGSFQATWDANGWPAALEQCGRRVIRVDLPGHGTAVASLEPKDYGDLASELAKQLAGEPGFDVVGYSLGAKLGLVLALRRLSNIRRLVLGGLGGNVFVPEKLSEAVASALVDGMHSDTPAAIRALVAYVAASGTRPAAAAAVLRRPANPVITPYDLSTLNALPALIVVGSNDTIAQPVEPLRQALPNAELLELADVDHLDLPAEPRFQRAALNFLNAA